MRTRALENSSALLALCVMTILGLGLMLGLSPAACHGAPGKVPSLYAVVVGIKEYQDPRIPCLTRPVRDARDFYGLLKQRENLFSEAHITLLLNDQATRANVASALRKGLKPAGKDDIVIIYLSGHGAAHPNMPNEFYFLTCDAKWDNLFGTALLMNDTNLFKGVDSDNVLLLADACYSGGFGAGLDKVIAKSATRFLSLFQELAGRVAISSSRPDELSYEKRVYGNSIFTHFLLKGLRGEAARGSRERELTAKQLYDYVYRNTKKASAGYQSPQLYCARGAAQKTPVFLVPKYADPLNLKVQFFYEDRDKKVKPLTNGTTLTSGQHVGIAFRAEQDCYVYVFWWDSAGKAGMLFPNLKLTDGTAEVEAEKTYWLPSKSGERWYVLDKTPGTETVYFVASRERNEKLEELYRRLTSESALQEPARRQARAADKARAEMALGTRSSQGASSQRRVAREIERELNLMGFADYTVAKGRVAARQAGRTPNTKPARFDQTVSRVAYKKKENLFENMENRIKVAGADAVFKVRFKHVNP